MSGKNNVPLGLREKSARSKVQNLATFIRLTEKSVSNILRLCEILTSSGIPHKHIFILRILLSIPLLCAHLPSAKSKVSNKKCKRKQFWREFMQRKILGTVNKCLGKQKFIIFFRSKMNGEAK